LGIREDKKVKRPRKDKSKDYVDNEKLYLAIKEYKIKLKECEEQGLPLPQMPDYIGVAAKKISENYANNYSYRSYIFREELILDGIWFCIKAVSSFNPDKFNNPFTYFTQAVQFGFWQRIEKEKKHQYTKFKMIDKASIYHEMYEGDAHNSTSADMPYSESSVDGMRSFIKTYEDSLDRKKQEMKDKKKKTDNDEDLIDEDSDSD
jgi:hypothetical protein